MSKINDIHDGTFKDILKYKDTAKNLLKVTLPEEIYNSIDLSKGINSVNTEKRGLQYKKKLLDAALQVTLKNNKKAQAYFIIEHKSESAKFTPLQILSYMLCIWEDNYNQGKELEFIIQIVFYHGKGKWPHPVDFRDFINVEEGLKKYSLDFRYFLFDTNDWDAEDLRKENILDMFFYAFILTFKHIFDKDLGELKKSVKYLSSEEGSGWILIFDYIVNKKDIREEEFIEVVKEAVGGDKMPTLAERWIQQGEQRGIIYGETKSKQDTIIRLMSLKFSITDSEKEFIKSVTDLDKLDKATEAILSEESKAKLLDLLK